MGFVPRGSRGWHWDLGVRGDLGRRLPLSSLCAHDSSVRILIAVCIFSINNLLPDSFLSSGVFLLPVY